MSKLWKKVWSPVGVTLTLMLVVTVWVLARSDWDALSFVRVGTQYSEGNSDGTEGYDGQFVYYIARDLNPETVSTLLDSPAYRYQRILLPLLAKILSFGNIDILAWVMIMVGIMSHVGGTWAVGRMLGVSGINRWYGLVYGLWVGFILAVRLDLPEPLAYGLVAGALLCNEVGKKKLSWGLYGLAVFAKEVTLIFVAAQLVSDLLRGRKKDVIGLAVFSVVPFGVFQLWLLSVFGEFGIGSGGAMATPFEVVPFMGLMRVLDFSTLYFWALFALYAPFLIFPCLWGVFTSLKKWIVEKQVNVIVLGLLLNAAIIPFTPFSTFREPGGMLRFTSGLVLAVLLYSGKYQIKRGLNYSVFWMVLNVILLNEI